MPDDYERASGTDVFRNDALEDTDGDGVTNLDEYNAGTDPLEPTRTNTTASSSPSFSVSTRNPVPDYDLDGLPDWWERLYAFTQANNGPNDDPDNDGLSNVVEFNNGSNPLFAENHALSEAPSPTFALATRVFRSEFTFDTDGDGLPDWWELKYGLNVGVDDSSTDFDADGEIALQEYQAGRDPRFDDLLIDAYALSSGFSLRTVIARLDTDRDGIPDAWEMLYSLNPLATDTGEDLDGDGFTNLEEYNSGTNPRQAERFNESQRLSATFNLDTGGMRVSYWQDSDLEGMPDWWELRYALDSRRNDALENPDQDLLNNLQEFRFGTHPRIYDSQRPEDLESNSFSLNTGGAIDQDLDGLPDGWERQYFGGLERFPTDDADGDSLSNIEEYRAGTNPRDPASILRGTVSLTDSGVVIRWSSVPGLSYRILALETLAPASQRSLVGEIQAQLPESTHTIQLQGTQRFFILEVR